MKSTIAVVLFAAFCWSANAQLSESRQTEVAGPAKSQEINACKYLLVGDFTNDPYGIAEELRAQARSRGFTVVSNESEVPPDNLFKTCVLRGSWSAGQFGGQVSTRVLGAVDGELVGEAETRGTDWWGVGRTVRKAVAKLYKQLGYTGYSETAFRARMQRLYPPRPKLTITEAQITRSEPRNAPEGIWSDPQNRYRFGIVKAPEGSAADYVAVILQSDSPLWQPNEIKGEIRSTASPDVFTCTWFMADKKPAGTTLSLEHDSVLRGSISTAKGPYDLVLLRVWPKVTDQAPTSASEHAEKSGTGFLLTHSGLIATNWHVVSGAKRIAVTFHGWKDSASADLVVRDTANDLAIIRVSDSTKLADLCRQLPFQLISAKDVALGQRVSTIGYPLSPLLGSDPKFSEGVISSKSGFQDDPRWFQISAAIQPGSSGSPLFDDNGNIVAVVVASLDAAKAFQLTNAIPQNVNWAIKSDYLLNLAGMIPDVTLPSRAVAFSADKASACVALVTAW